MSMYHISNENVYKASNFAFVAIFIEILMMMRCWIGFGDMQNTFQYILFFILIVSWKQGTLTMVFKKKYKIFAFLVLVYLLYLQRNFADIQKDLYRVVFAVNVFLILSIHDSTKRDLFSFIIKWFGLLMIPGLFLYAISINGGLPFINSIYGEYEGGFQTRYLFSNYIFLLYPQEIKYIGRFNGPFIEPGDLGCTASFMLLAARFQFKRYKYLWAIFIALIATQSLAGYMLSLFGYVICLFYNGKLSFKYALGLCIAVIGIYFFANYYNDGDNFLQNKIFSRLESDEDKGFSGNNRNSDLMTLYFYEMFNNTHTLWFGYDRQTLEYIYETGTGTGAGAVSKIVSGGLIGFIGICLPYWMIYRKSVCHGFALAFFLFFMLYMFQRADAFWIGFVLCYVYGIDIYEMDNQEFNC